MILSRVNNHSLCPPGFQEYSAKGRSQADAATGSLVAIDHAEESCSDSAERVAVERLGFVAVNQAFAGRD